MKHYSINKSSFIPPALISHSKSNSSCSVKKKKTCFNFWKNSEQGEKQLQNILEVWQMVSAVGMDIS